MKKTSELIFFLAVLFGLMLFFGSGPVMLTWGLFAFGCMVVIGVLLGILNEKDDM